MADVKTPEDLLIEAAVRREVQRQLAATPSDGASKQLRADEYDFVAHPNNIHPGPGWFLVQAFGGVVPGTITLLWAISRVQQTAMKQAPVMPLPGVKPNP